MICPNCKKEIKDNSKFCSSCGGKIPDKNQYIEWDTDLKDNNVKKTVNVVLIVMIVIVVLSGVGVAGYFILDRDLIPALADTETEESTGTKTVIDRTIAEDEDIDDEKGDIETAEDFSISESEKTENSEKASSMEAEPSYEHTYEVFSDDVSWQEAERACEAMGGYLATITSEEEYDRVSNLAAESGLTYLWIGASLDTDSDEWSDKSWVTGEKWTFEKWYPGEPSREDSDGVKENYLCLWNAKYDGVEMGWTFNDERNDLVEALPYISGKIGYICEFEREVR